MRSERPNPVGVRILAGAKVRGGFTCRRHDILERRKVFVSVRVGFAMQEPRQPRPQDWNRMGACEFWIFYFCPVSRATLVPQWDFWFVYFILGCGCGCGIGIWAKMASLSVGMGGAGRGRGNQYVVPGCLCF